MKAILMMTLIGASSQFCTHTPKTEQAPKPIIDPLAERLTHKQLWLNPNTPASQAVADLPRKETDKARLLRKISSTPQAEWLGDWTPDIAKAVDQILTQAHAAKAVPAIVIYNIPQRDCGQHSAGGAENQNVYLDWVQRFASGLKGREAIVILEPDALALMSQCLDSKATQRRLSMIRQAVERLKSEKGTAVYIDAGNANWVPPQKMARMLKAAGIDQADGFAVNVSNYMTDEASVQYGKKLSALIGYKRFIVDSSRNGQGPTTDYQWCNPRNRGLGRKPTLNTGHELVDAYLWVKRPGESDGKCNGGPDAGRWWQEIALELARNASF
jgi:endoglucanase